MLQTILRLVVRMPLVTRVPGHMDMRPQRLSVIGGVWGMRMRHRRSAKEQVSKHEHRDRDFHEHALWYGLVTHEV
jgi:hypothetical protein